MFPCTKISAEDFFTFFLQVKEIGQGIFFQKSYTTKSCWKVKFAVSAPLHSTFANGPILQGSSASNIKKGLVVQRTQCSTCNSVRCHLMDWFNQRSKSREGSKTDSREIYDISSRYLKCWCHITRGQGVRGLLSITNRHRFFKHYIDVGSYFYHQGYRHFWGTMLWSFQFEDVLEPNHC